jgi:hypothetical protein
MLFLQRKNVLKIKSIYHTPRRTLYYDNIKTERNLDFIFNLGYNKIGSDIQSNLSVFSTIRFFTRQILIRTIKRNYHDLLIAIEKADTKRLEELLENRISRVLLKDLIKISEKDYSVHVINKNSPIFVKVLNIYEFTNVKLNRDLNEDVEGYELKFRGKNKLVFKNLKYEPLKGLNKRSREETERERKIFEKSEEYNTSLDNVKREAEFEFNLRYIYEKVGRNPSESNIKFYENLVSSLKKMENENSLEAQEYKKEFKDYFIDRDKYVNNKVSTTDIYIHFRDKMPSNYTKLFKKNNPSSFNQKLKEFLIYVKDKFNIKFSDFSRKFSRNYNKLFVFDVEIASKTRLEIRDKEGDNILEKDYNYSDSIKSSLNYLFQESNTVAEYDTSLYKLRPNDHIWDVNNPEFLQRHVIRFEFERKSMVQFMLKNPLNKMKITDIDIALRGNKHFNLEKI